MEQKRERCGRCGGTRRLLEPVCRACMRLERVKREQRQLAADRLAGKEQALAVQPLRRIRAGEAREEKTS